MANKEFIDKVWEKGKTIRSRNPDTWRRDAAGNVIRKGSYGTQGEYGWEIDHETPAAKRGGNAQSRLKPLRTVATALRHRQGKSLDVSEDSRAILEETTKTFGRALKRLADK